VADDTSGNSEELKLRITPELNDAALKKVQDQLDDIKGTVQLGGKTGGKGAGASDEVKREVAALKELLRTQDLLVKQADVRLRKVRSNAEREITSIRERGAAEKLSLSEINNLISVQEGKIQRATQAAEEAYRDVGMELDRLKVRYEGIDQAQTAIVNSQGKLFYANERLQSGFNSMSGSMQGITSQTKNASLAFMNFGRIVQDAPFGLIGISNNIDPLLVSFRHLSQEIDITTGRARGALGAFKAMGAQLLGPAGLIFLLGSALPSALLVLQSRQRESKKESDKLADAFERVREEFAKLAAEAAGEKGLEAINEELAVSEKALENVDKAIKKLNRDFLTTAENQTRASAAAGVPMTAILAQQEIIVQKLKEENKEKLKSLDNTKSLLETNIEQLKNKNEQLEADNFIKQAREQLGIAESLSLKETQERQKELNDLKQEELDVTNEISAEIFRQSTSIQTRINELRSQLIKEEDIQRKAQLQRTISALEEDLTKVEARVRAKFAETLSKSELEALRKRQEFLARFNQFVDEVNRQSLIGTIQLEDNRLNVVKEFFQKVREEYKKEVIQQRKDFEALFVEPFQNRTKLFDQQQQASLDMQLMAAEVNGDKITQIEIDRITRLKNLEELARKNNLLGTKQYEAAKAAIELDSDEKIRQSKIDSQTEIFQAVGELASASIGMIFGESKNAQVAQVVIDTIMGIQKIWSQAGLNPVVGALGSAALAAKGLAAINKIKSTTPKSSSISGGSGGATTREVMAEGIGPRAGQIINPYGTIMSASAQPTNNVMMADISIDARVDRRGLAIAVREGEQEIRTQQFSYT
jgi:hypothetical protein